MTEYCYIWTSFIIKASTHYVVWTDITMKEHTAKTVEELKQQLEDF